MFSRVSLLWLAIIVKLLGIVFELGFGGVFSSKLIQAQMLQRVWPILVSVYNIKTEFGLRIVQRVLSHHSVPVCFLVRGKKYRSPGRFLPRWVVEVGFLCIPV